MGWYRDDDGCVDFELSEDEFEDIMANYDGDSDAWMDDHYDEHDALINEDDDE